MPFGILEDHKMEIVPGTAAMRDQGDLPPELQELPAERLKHGKGKYSHILLVPQPSDSPNDPLNWPTWKKDTILLIVGFASAVVGAYGPMLGPGFVPISKELGVSVNTLSQATAWVVLTLGLCVFLINPFAKLFGKRPMYLLTVVLLVIVSIWGAEAQTYRSFLGSRIIGGIGELPDTFLDNPLIATGMAPYEVLVQATIGDMYFVHERATRIAVWNLFLTCGICGASFVSGYIIDNLGYHWTFGVCGILFGASLIGIVFFVPETSYNRPRVNLNAVVREGKYNSDEDISKKKGALPEHTEELTVEFPGSTEPKMPYWRTVLPWTGQRYSRAPVWKVFSRPIVMFFYYPAVVWGFLIYGTTLTWIVVFSVVNGVLFVQPPYNFSVSEVGLTGISPLILVLIAEVISGPLNDWICLKLAHRNHGVYEPEFRLPLMLVVVFIGCIGFYGFGITFHDQTHWAGPVLTYGIANATLAFAGVCVFGYILDSFPNLAEEAFVAINARNFLTFGLTFFVNSWIASSGVLSVFNVLGSCFLAVCLLTIPLWIYGKRNRSWIARNEFLKDFMTD